MGNRCGIYMNIHKVMISKCQDNDHMFGEKIKREKKNHNPILHFKQRIYFVSQSADVMRK